MTSSRTSIVGRTGAVHRLDRDLHPDGRDLFVQGEGQSGGEVVQS